MMRILPLLSALALLAPMARAEDEVSEDAVKAVRALLGAKHMEEQAKLRAELFQRKDLNWDSLRKGLAEGPYYQKPLVTAFGERGSKKHFDAVWSGEDGTPRGFSLYVPKKYDAQDPIPVLVYLHHSPHDPHVGRGAERAGVALFKFREVCEDYGILFVAPYTSKGAEWWTPQGRKLVEWTLYQVRKRYKIDDDRIALLGTQEAGNACWYLGQEMPGVWSALMPMSADPYWTTSVIRPLFLGTLDRMDILMGVPGKTKSRLGETDLMRFLGELRPMFGQSMRITTTIWPKAQGDFSYLEKITEQVASFVTSKKRSPDADEVDIETEAGHPLRSLWLRNDGFFAEGVMAPGHMKFGSTLLKWKAPDRKEQDKKLGIHIEARSNWDIGLVITATPGAAKHARILQRDVLLEADGQPVRKPEDLKAVLAKKKWDEDVHLLLARDVKESDLKRHDRSEARYKRYRKKIVELRAAGKPIPRNLWAEMQDVEDTGCGEEDDSDDEGDDEIVISDDENKPEAADAGGDTDEAGKGREKRHARIIERWVRLRRPAGPLVRADFGTSADFSHDKEGVKVGFVVPGSLAARAGLTEGDVIVQVGDTEVKKSHDTADYSANVNDGKPFRFEEEPEGENSVDFTVRRQNNDGTWTADRQVTCRWYKVRSSRVDGAWNKKDNALFVWTNKVSAFTLYFADEVIKPGREFSLFINGVPYQDLASPETAPKYPKIRPGTDPMVKDRLFRMRLKRAKVPGWTPDLEWALDEYLEHRDRHQIYGAMRTIDMTGMNDAFQKASHAAHDDWGKKRGARIKKAYDAHKEGGQ